MTSYDLVHVHVFHNNQTLHKIEKNPSHRILTRHVSDSTNSLKVANSNVINIEALLIHFMVIFMVIFWKLLLVQIIYH